MTSLKLDSSGQYTRQLGWLQGRTGQKKFRLGSDLPKAQLAYCKLGLLWDVVLSEFEARQQAPTYKQPPGMVVDLKQPNRPEWSEEDLAIAEAIRKHRHAVRIEPRLILDAEEGDSAYATHLAWLAQRVGHIISILPADAEAADRGRRSHQQLAEHRSRKARDSARIAQIQLPTGLVGATLYEAIEAYAEQVVVSNAKESGKVEAANVRRLKAAIHDIDLGDLGYSALERIGRYWAARPEARKSNGQGSGKPISITTVDNHLSTARRFIKWLVRADTYRWEMPRHGLDALTVNLKQLNTSKEIADRRFGVKVFSRAQLTEVYRAATDFERLLILLGLNAAMAQAEIQTLRWDEVESGVIKRIRHKSGVYGEFALWPETQSALAWWQRVRPSGGDLVMLTDRGNPYTRQRISNAWVCLHKRLERHTGQSCSWWLSFKYLRKTGAQMVRAVSDGEIAGVFLSHGQPVASDELADVYTNRPFNKVADALRTAHAQLEDMFAAAPNAFISETLGRRQRLSTKTV